MREFGTAKLKSAVQEFTESSQLEIRKKLKMCDLTFGIITVSDTCSRNEAVDLSGPHLQQLIDDKFGVKNVQYSLIPDEIDLIEVRCLI